VRAPMCEVFKSLAAKSEPHAAAAVATTYFALVSSTLEPELGRSLHEKLLDGNRHFDVPASTETVIELIMAQLDGRVACFERNKDHGLGPCGVRNVSLPPEAGIQGNWDSFELSFMETLCGSLGVRLHELHPDARRIHLNSQLRFRAASNDRAYGIDDSKKPKLNDSVAAELHRRYPEFVLVRMQPPDEAMEERQADAVAPLLSGELLPKSKRRP
ncbi:MAG TPA: hypothetical protein PLV92_24885, partial [Pirellulaceae bacterium]|nr:hypothetical protein [Pirellulaceae bacterium]